MSVWLPLPGSDNIDIVYVGTEVWPTPTARCSPPCILVMPNSILPSGTVIDPGNYTTSLEYGAPGSTTFVTTTTTVTIVISPITIPPGGGLPYSNVNITQGQTTGGFVASPSVDIPPIGIPLPDGQGGTTTRQVTPPPWPKVTLGPPGGDSWGFPSDPLGSSAGAAGLGFLTFHTGVTTTVVAAGPTTTTLAFLSVVSSYSVDCPLQTELTFATPRTTLTTSCASYTEIPVGFACPPTKIITFFGASTLVYTQDCTYVATVTPPSPGGGSITSPGGAAPSPTSSSSTTPLPIFTTWPGGAIVPIATSVDSPQPTDDGVKTPCKLWFFFVSSVPRFSIVAQIGTV